MASSTFLDIIIRARDEASAVFQRLGGAAAVSTGRLNAMGSRLTSVGSTMTRAVTPAALLLSVAFAKAGEEWDAASRTLRIGNTAKEFESLMRSAKNLSGEVTQPLSEVAEAMDTLTDRTGLVGKPLEALTKQFLELEHITGEAASATIPTVTRLFGDWKVKTRDQADTLNYLMRASETTGIRVQDLSDLMVRFGSPLRQLGFTFDESAAMFAKFEQEGVNITTAMPGLRMALKNLSAPSDDLSAALKRVGVTAKEPKDALMQVFDVIKKMPSTAKANALAFQLFGTRAGPDLAAAIREGRFNLKDLMNEVKSGKGTISGAAEESQSLADKVDMMKNKVVAAIGPWGDLGAILFGFVAGIGPFLMGLGQIIPLIGSIGSAIGKMFGFIAANPWMALVFLLIAAIVLIIANWDKVKAWLLEMWNSLKASWQMVVSAISAAWAAVVAWFQSTWQSLKASWQMVTSAIGAAWAAVCNWVKGIFNGVAAWLRSVWNSLKAAWQSIVRAIGAVWAAIWGAIKAVVAAAAGVIRGIVSALGGALRAIWNAIKAAASAVWRAILAVVRTVVNGIRTVSSTVFSFLKNGWNTVKSIAVGVWNAILGVARNVMSSIKGIWDSTIGAISRGISSVGGWVASKIPAMAKGGIVTRPTLALIGEAGPEAVVPLSGTGQRRLPTGGPGGPLYVNIDRRRWWQEVDYDIAYGGLGG